MPDDHDSSGRWPPLDHLDLTRDDAYEWLLSDHPWARTERHRQRHDHHTRTSHDTTLLTAWSDRINHQPRADDSEAVGRLAHTDAGNLARDEALRADINDAEPEVLVATARRRLEAARHTAGDPHYTYPTRLLGPAAHNVPCPTIAASHL